MKKITRWIETNLLFVRRSLFLISLIILNSACKKAPPEANKKLDPIDQFMEIAKSSEEVERYSLLELTFKANVTAKAAFDPDQIEVDAILVAPSGKIITMPGFYYQDYTREVNGLSEKLTPKDGPVWKVRFAPAEEGSYTYTVTVKDKSGTKTSPKGGFICSPSSNHGNLRVSKSDPHYFEFEDKTPYFAIGQNVCWYQNGNGTPEYDKWFGRMAENNENYARLWMSQSSFGLETLKIGSYNMDQAWQLDYVLHLAEHKGIYIKLCLSAWRKFESGTENPYWAVYGGPCETELDFITKDEPRRLFRNRLRYIVARWGYSPNIMGWELWNEFNTIKGYAKNTTEFLKWTAEMARYIKSIDPYNHMTTTSLGSCNIDEDLWRLPEMDWAQMHGYYFFSDAMERDAKDMGYFIPLWLNKIRTFNKPAMFAEFGISKENAPEMFVKDTSGVSLHTGIWSAIMAGGGGTAMLWWWNNQVDPLNWYHHYKSVAEFTRDVPWTTSGFIPDTLVCSKGLKCYMLEGTNLRLLWMYNTDYTWWNVANGTVINPVVGGQVAVDRMGQNSVYTVEWWDTYKGNIIKTENIQSTDGQIILNVPPLTNDIATKITRKL